MRGIHPIFYLLHSWSEHCIYFQLLTLFTHDLSYILLGRKKRKHPFIVSAKENFSAIMHPFAVNKEWCRGLGDKDRKKLEGWAIKFWVPLWDIMCYIPPSLVYSGMSGCLNKKRILQSTKGTFGKGKRYSLPSSSPQTGAIITPTNVMCNTTKYSQTLCVFCMCLSVHRHTICA